MMSCIFRRPTEAAIGGKTDDDTRYLGDEHGKVVELLPLKPVRTLVKGLCSSVHATVVVSMSALYRPRLAAMSSTTVALTFIEPFLGLDTGKPAGDRFADLVGAVFLNEVNAGHGGLGLVWPGAHKLALGPGQDRAWLCIDEELW
jgi:hypothetical protein